jgi:hypothetical protein
MLQFRSADRGRVELVTRLLRFADVGTEVEKVGDRDVWRAVAYTDMLAAGRVELRKALAEIVETARANGWVDADKAELWLKKLERGRMLMEGWPRYHVRLARSGALEFRFSSTDPDSIEREAQRLREMGLKRGVHFTVKMPEGDKMGYVSILKEGLAHAAWLSEYGSGEQQRLAAEFVEYILRRADEAGDAVSEKAKKIIEEGVSRGSLRLTDVREAEVEVGGGRYAVNVLGGGAEFDVGRSGKKLLKIRITAEVNGVRCDYEITFGRYVRNKAEGRAYASAKAPGGREADAERFAAVIKALTGEEPWIYRIGNKIMMIKASRRLQTLRRAGRCHREVAGGDRPVNA